MSESDMVSCPSCGIQGKGTYCGGCGTSLAAQSCTGCGAPMVSGAGFCAECGHGIGAPGASSAPPARARLRWVGVALGSLALVALIWAAVGSDVGAAPAAAAPAAGAGAAPDISNLTPRQQFARLAERVETAMEAGDTSTVVGFFPMVEAAFANLSDDDRDIDARLHLSLLRARVGHASTAVAQVDTIAAEAPNHLFADYLRAIIADFENDGEAAAAARQAFRRHYPAETATTRPEYLLHRQMLDQFLATIPDPQVP